jgi:hypothetical protein
VKSALADEAGAEEASKVLCAPSPCVSWRIAATTSAALGSARAHDDGELVADRPTRP